MSKRDTKHRSDVGTRASEQIKAIHKILDEHDGAEAVRRIREVMYGPPPPGSKDEDEEGGDADV
jgi:hypothetical protein